MTLLSSYELKLNGVCIQHHRKPVWQFPEHHHEQHEIIIFQFERVAQVERILDGRRQHEQIGNQEVVLIPATMPHQSGWEQGGEYTLLFLEPQYLTNVAQEFVNGNNIEIVPHFAMPDRVIHQIGTLLKKEVESDGLLGSRLYLDSLINTLTIHLLRNYSTWKQPIQTYTGGLPNYKLQTAIAYIKDHLDQDLSLDAIAGSLHMGSCYFASLFKQSIGVTPHQYVLRCRVEKAKQLLAKSSLTIVEIYPQLGFKTQSHFIQVFRKHTGVTPKVFRNAL